MTLASAPAQPKTWTYADYARLPEDNRHREVIGGELRVAASPNLNHQRTLKRLGVAIDRFVTENSLGEVFLAPMDVVLSDTDIVQPDILFVPSAKKHLLSNRKNVWGAPDLVVEILSPGSEKLDRTTKAVLYARHLIPEYWIVDTNEQRVDVFVLERGSYYAREFAESGAVQSQVLSGLSVALSDNFADLD